MTVRRRWAWTMTAALMLGGCGGAGMEGFGLSDKPGPPRVQRVDGLNLWASAMMTDVDGKPGADGISVRLTMYQVAGGKVRPVSGDNSVELLVFDGGIRGRDLGTAEPLYAWRFTPTDLRPFLSRYYGLWCYEMSIQWDEVAPDSAVVTAVGRYRNPSGEFLYSAPTTVRIRR